MMFINEHWSRGHILSCNREVFDWYYRCSDGSYNFFIGKNNDEIFGILGFINSDKFSNDKSENNEIWLALWKVRAESPNTGLGLRLIMELKKYFSDSKIAVLGLSNEAEKIYKLLRYKVSSMSQLFIVNNDLKENFKIFKGEITPLKMQKSDINVYEVENFSKINDVSCVKDDRGRGFDYFLNKYFLNRFKKYLFFKLIESEKNAYIIARVDEVNGAKALRVVDVYGEVEIFSKSISWFYEYIKDHCMEYMDFYYFGEQEKLFLSAGMLKVSDEYNYIVPNYFYPFIQENINLKCAYDSNFNGPFFKGDGDQERPSGSV